METGDWVVVKEGETEFKGWDYTEHECHILRYRKVTQKKQTFYQIVLDYTPFYAEMGGQVGDRGVLCSEHETIEIVDTKRENNLPVHIAKTLPEHPEADFMACVDTDLRAASEANHTCTHLLDQALRTVLGEHVEQKGSLVTPEYLRFDFSHFQKVTDEQLREVERIVNAKIREDLPLQDHRDMPIEKAKELGAIALFGEKYGDRVRVVQFGDSVEFCGGCHAKSTGRIGMMKILSDSSVAAGIRRIEAITGEKVENMLYTLQDLTNELRTMFNNAPDVKAAILKSIEENATLKKQIEESMKEKAAQAKARIVSQAAIVNGVTLYRGILPMPADLVKDMAFQLRNGAEDALVIIGSLHEGKPMLTAAASDNMVKAHGMNVGQIIREAAKLIRAAPLCHSRRQECRRTECSRRQIRRTGGIVNRATVRHRIASGEEHDSFPLFSSPRSGLREDVEYPRQSSLSPLTHESFYKKLSYNNISFSLHSQINWLRTKNQSAEIRFSFSAD